MPNTTYKGYSVPTTGTEPGTWGADLNTNTFAVIDANLGGVLVKTLGGSNVTLTSAESQYLILRLIGTLTAPVQITTPCQGFTVVVNATNGSYPVTITNGVGVSQVVGQGFATMVIFDAVNGPRNVAEDIQSGSAMLFIQSSAPYGWTKVTTYNDRALRIVSGSAGSGGNTAFSSVFRARTLTVNQLPVHSHGVVDPGHTHRLGVVTYYGSPTNAGPVVGPLTGAYAASEGATTGITIANNGSGADIDFSVLYVDAIIAIKN